MQHYYSGTQSSLLSKENNPTAVGNFLSYNLPSPYKNPEQNYGNGPYIYNTVNSLISSDGSGLRQPTVNNPFMNVMPMDYDSPQVFADYVRYEALGSNRDGLKTREQVKQKFEDGLVQNSDSLLWNRLNSQRQYVSQPSGSVPNDQAEFANWLYSSPGNCKQGSVFANYGVAYTKDSLLCNGFNAASPTNKGLLSGNLMSSVEQ